MIQPTFQRPDDASRPRLVFLTQLFDPEPTPKGLAFARALVDQGFSVEVVTGFPNYPGGKVYDGYRIRPIQREIHDGVEVTRLAMYPSHDRSALRRMACYASFMVSALVYLLFRARRADVIHAYYPMLPSALAAVIVKLFRGSGVVLDIQDLWPDSLSSTGMVKDGLLTRTIGALCRFVYRRADEIVVLSPGFRDLLIQRGVPEAKIGVIYNWANELPAAAPLAEQVAFSDRGEVAVLFAGNMGAAQDLKSVIRGAVLAHQQRPAIGLYLLGSGVELDELKRFSDDIGARNVTFLPRVSSDVVPGYLAAADILLVHLKPDPLFAITIPSKTQAYLYAGKPVLIAVEGDAARLVSEAGAGMAARAGDSTSIAETLVALHDLGEERRTEMGAAGRRFYDDTLSRAAGVEAFSLRLSRAVAR